MPNKQTNTQYYCVGFTWRGTDPESQLPRFMNEGIWENGFEDKYLERVQAVPVGSRIAAKTTYTIKEDDEPVSILEIYATGSVTDNPDDGQILNIKWDKPFKPFIIKNKGAYRSTISRINNIETIREIFKNDKILNGGVEIPFYLNEELKKDYHLFPCFVLTKRSWDDFGIQAQYDVDYCISSRETITIGYAKFFNRNDNSGTLPNAFTTLDDHICSLGQSNSYYSILREKIDKKVADYFLDAVNDLAINRGLVNDFEHEDGFKKSLIRSSEAQKALREGARIYKGIKFDNTLHFTFSTQMEHATEPHKIKFDFVEIEQLPYRIKVLIGKNGTGKTQYIARLASTLSGYEEQGEFSTKYLPPFSRVIAVSYSLFDRFPRPKQTKTFSYYYCGFQSGKGFLTENQIHTRLRKAFVILEKSNRMRLFGDCISLVLSTDIAEEILDQDFLSPRQADFTLYDNAGNSTYSSGQIVMILMLAEVIAYITEESLLLFDEPETHLHPNSISLFVNVINKILKRFDSYAIVATHSPQIVQEVPAKDIIVIEREQDVPIVRELPIESFGENLNTITERIFHTTSHDEYYRESLETLSKVMTYEKVITLFEDNSLPLSLNAKIYLQSLYQ